MHSNRGFGLIELLVVIVIIAILATVVLIMINPVETNREARDSKRLEDFRNLRTALELKRGEGINVLCGDNPAPCPGNSNSLDPKFRSTDGSGWLKMPFSDLIYAIMPTLPVDPINDAKNNYSYYSDGYDYEINTKLESSKYKELMVKDGGDNPDYYEIGSRLDLL